MGRLPFSFVQVQLGERDFRTEGDIEMKRGRKDEAVQEFSGPLWDDHPREFGDRAVLAALLEASYEHPDCFDEEWVTPLLAEGLDFDRVFHLLLCGAVRPN